MDNRWPQSIRCIVCRHRWTTAGHKICVGWECTSKGTYYTENGTWPRWETSSASWNSHAGVTGWIRGQVGLEADRRLWNFTTLQSSSIAWGNNDNILEVSIARKISRTANSYAGVRLLRPKEGMHLIMLRWQDIRFHTRPQFIHLHVLQSRPAPRIWQSSCQTQG